MIFHMDKHHGLLTDFDFGDADDEEDIYNAFNLLNCIIYIGLYIGLVFQGMESPELNTRKVKVKHRTKKNSTYLHFCEWNGVSFHLWG